MLYDVHLARDIKGNKKQFCKCFGDEGKKKEKYLVWYLGGMTKGKPSTKETLKKL